MKDIRGLTKDEDEKILEMARTSGRTYQECAEKFLAKQKSLEDFEK